MYETFKKTFRDLETQVLSALRDEINKSEVISKHIDTPVIPINIGNYTELAIVDDRHRFIDDNGYHYDIWNGVCTLEDLIDILNNL
jgi:hypothetical protein